jgi:hypothetical protein
VSSRFHFKSWKAVPLVALVAAGAVVAGTAIAGPGDVETKSEHWGAIARNTIGSPVMELRDGPYALTSTGDVTEPPFGKGSLGIEVADRATSLAAPQEKAAYGNEVDFFGEPVLGLTAVGFHVFQTGENVSYGGVNNLPNITFEIDPNLTANPTNFSSMVWVPNGTGVPLNQWSGYIDATTNGQWYLTGSAGTTTGCNQATMCSFTGIKTALNDGGASGEPIILTAAVVKGRDNMWIGAVDGLRINGKSYDFEGEPKGVKAKSVK